MTINNFEIAGSFKKGNTPWNKGKTGLQKAWNKNLKGWTNSGSFKIGHKSLISKGFTNKGGFKKGHKMNIGRIPTYTFPKGFNSWTVRKPVTQEYRNNLSKKTKERMTEEMKKKLSNSGKKYYQDHPEAIIRIKQNRIKQVFPIKDTKIEIKIQNYLKRLGIEFYTHRYMKIEHDYQTDIFIPSIKTIIECDGDYWHGNILKYPKLNDKQLNQIEKDKIRTEELKAKGYRVLRIWENEIKNLSLNKFNEILKN